MKKLIVLFALTSALAGVPALAEDASKWPSQPVKLIVNVTPGGGIDTATRIIAAKLSERFNQPFVVENHAGASGNLAADQVYRAAPDGYTLLSCFGATISISDLLFKDINFDPTRLEPASLLTSVPLALIVRPDFPATDAKEFIAYAGSAPDRRAVHDRVRHQNDAYPLQGHGAGHD
jgi:tripartite-type tricarboxylate transporter receptor subunit TctC